MTDSPDRLQTTVDLGQVVNSSLIDSLSSPVQQLTTGYALLDEVLGGGIQREEFVVIAGRPGIGKTITLVQWIRHLARSGTPSMIASYEHREFSLICQLLRIELGELDAVDPAAKIFALQQISDISARRLQWTDAVRSNPLLSESASRLGRYAPLIHSLPIDVLRNGFEALARGVSERRVEVLVIDHLQKVPLPGVDSSEPIGSRLKELAVEQQIAVVAASPIGDSGLSTRRLRLEHLRDAAAVAHEADAIVVLNEKLLAVSRSHTSFDSVRARSFRHKIIFTVEKNRRGMSAVNLEFEADFAFGRFDPEGHYVTESLVDGVLVRD